MQISADLKLVVSNPSLIGFSNKYLQQNTLKVSALLHLSSQIDRVIRSHQLKTQNSFRGRNMMVKYRLTSVFH